MSYIVLSKDGKGLGKFNMPEHITSKTGIYKLNRAELKGGNSLVFNATKMITFNQPGPLCAVKFLRQLGGARIDRFNNEIRVLKSLSSPFIAEYHDDGELILTNTESGENKVRWLAMELGNQNLRQYVEQHGPLKPEKLMSSGSNICDAISALHMSDFIHRDIKPDNFVWDTKQDILKMIDFGLAKRINEDVSARPMDTFTQIKEFVGPVFFSSPELIEYAANKKHPVDHRSDIFQIGKVIWFMATGKISAGVPSKKDCPMGGALRNCVLEMIDDDPDSRPQTITEVKDMILNL